MKDNQIKSGYDKLNPTQKRLIDQVMANLESGAGIWKQGWKGLGAPVSAITGKSYKGNNRFALTLAMMLRGYTDNRWLTYKQMSERGWSFKRDAEGNSLGRNAGEAIEYWELRDKVTKQPFDKHKLDGMTQDERNDYMEENTYMLRKYYRVFNADVIEGIPAREQRTIDPNERNERAESILQLWNDTESKIYYGGDQAYYNSKRDDIHLPERGDFYNLSEFYSTALHEVGHSTGHETRLNRNLGGKFGTLEYAEEELRAEIASMFIEQDLGIELSEEHIGNNSAYIQAWKEKLKEDPNVLFTAIADADKICKFVMEKEKAAKKEIEPFAIIEDTDEYNNPVYKVCMASEYGQTRMALGGFRSREELMAEFCKMQELPFWAGKEFQEVSFEELEEMSRKRAEEQNEKAEQEERIEEEKSEIYIPPSEVAAQVAEGAAVVAAVATVEAAGREIDGLTRMDDREIVERAGKTKHGDKFMALFNGESKLGSEEKDERSLMARLAMMTGDNERQLMRIFRASGQFREDKPISYYEKMAKEEMKFVSGLRASAPRAIASGKQGGRFANAK